LRGSKRKTRFATSNWREFQESIGREVRHVETFESVDYCDGDECWRSMRFWPAFIGGLSLASGW
jgi:hypothetical protein